MGGVPLFLLNDKSLFRVKKTKCLQKGEKMDKMEVDGKKSMNGRLNLRGELFIEGGKEYEVSPSTKQPIFQLWRKEFKWKWWSPDPGLEVFVGRCPS